MSKILSASILPVILTSPLRVVTPEEKSPYSPTDAPFTPSNPVTPKLAKIA